MVKKQNCAIMYPYSTILLFYGKSIENVSLNRDINFVAAERRGKYLTSEPNYHATKAFTENYQE